MERIMIEVTDAAAKKWRFRNIEKIAYFAKMDALLNVILDKSDDDFWPFLENLKKSALRICN